MSGFNIQKIILSLYNPELLFKKLNNQENKPQLLTPEFNAQMQNGAQVQNQNQNSAMLLQNLQNQAQANLNDIQTQAQQQTQGAQNNQQPVQNQAQQQTQGTQNNQQPVQNQTQQQVAQNQPVVQNQAQPQVVQNNQPVIQNQAQSQIVQNQPVIQNKIQQPQVNQKPIIQNTQNQNLQNTISEFNLRQSQAQNQSFNNQPILQASKNTDNLIQNLQNSNIQNTDRSVYIKSLLNLPQNLADILLQLQNPQKPINKSTLSLGLINHELMQNKKVIESLFNENKQIQPIIEQINALNNMQVQNAKVQRDAVALFFSGMVSMPDVSKLILQNSKHAIASLIIAMAAASRQGGKNEQLHKALNIINSCIAMAESDNPAQTLKSLMLLYLPWLPLNDGVGFDLEITPDSGENESNNSKLTVLIQTRNYGNIKGDFVLTTSNSVDILITCSEIFPKKELERNLKSESNAHAMNTNIDIEEVIPLQEDLKDTHETKVNLSATNEMNPYLLLMAHSFIRNTILIDNNALI